MKEEKLREFIKRKNNPLADTLRLSQDRKQLLYWDTSNMSPLERELLNEALN